MSATKKRKISHKSNEDLVYFPFERLLEDLRLLILAYLPLVDICSIARTAKRFLKYRDQDKINLCKSIPFYIFSHHQGLWSRMDFGTAFRICSALSKIRDEFFRRTGPIPWNGLSGEFIQVDQRVEIIDSESAVWPIEAVVAYLLVQDRDEDDDYYDEVYKNFARLNTALEKISFPRDRYSTFLIGRKTIEVNLANAMNDESDEYYYEIVADSDDENEHFIKPGELHTDLVIGGRGYEGIDITPSFFLSHGIFRLNLSVSSMCNYIS